ncbi:hypothetical protein TNCV_2134901 [Trichonephila clavipes]|nr:hypothetical protein TNCV_2134901 [Trichonephila clavipes]
MMLQKDLVGMHSLSMFTGSSGLGKALSQENRSIITHESPLTEKTALFAEGPRRILQHRLKKLQFLLAQE